MKKNIIIISFIHLALCPISISLHAQGSFGLNPEYRLVKTQGDILNGTLLGTIWFEGLSGGQYLKRAAIQAVATENVSGALLPVDIVISNGIEGLSENMRITSSGNAFFPSGNVFIPNGKLLVGTSSISDNYIASFNGRVIATELVIELYENWPDYVFYPSYQLLPLKELELYLLKNKHLPDVPSSQEIAENGLNVGEMQATLLKKIEELTLYIIALDKQHDQKIMELLNRVEQLEKH